MDKFSFVQEQRMVGKTQGGMADCKGGDSRFLFVFHKCLDMREELKMR
jgi:hypothetical protein